VSPAVFPAVVVVDPAGPAPRPRPCPSVCPPARPSVRPSGHRRYGCRAEHRPSGRWTGRCCGGVRTGGGLRRRAAPAVGPVRAVPAAGLVVRRVAGVGGGCVGGGCRWWVSVVGGAAAGCAASGLRRCEPGRPPGPRRPLCRRRSRPRCRSSRSGRYRAWSGPVPAVAPTAGVVVPVLVPGPRPAGRTGGDVGVARCLRGHLPGRGRGRGPV